MSRRRDAPGRPGHGARGSWGRRRSARTPAPRTAGGRGTSGRRSRIPPVRTGRAACRCSCRRAGGSGSDPAASSRRMRPGGAMMWESVAPLTTDEERPVASEAERLQSGRPHPAIPFRTAVRTWFAISLQTFGGPAGQIAVMQRTLVDDKRWIGQRRFLHAMNYCMLLPGPEAQQLATYVGWLLHGTRGGLVAGGLFVLPGVVALLVLSAIYVAFGSTTAVLAVFAGLAPAVLAIVVQAVIRVAGRALNSWALWTIAVVAFLSLALFGVPFPAVVAVAGLAGWALHRWRPSALPQRQKAETADAGPPPVIPDDVLHT